MFETRVLCEKVSLVVVLLLAAFAGARIPSKR